ncbi:MAG: fructose-bisphosphate aldolase [Bacteroidales bacterium]|nr:fructose-bisphosphate aldolase [Bacteroidales bacterium]
MNAQGLIKTTNSLAAHDREILAIDESNPSYNKHFTKLGIPQTEEARRDYRAMIVATPGFGDCINEAIFYDETMRQNLAEGAPFIQAVIKAGIFFRSRPSAAGDENLEWQRNKYSISTESIVSPDMVQSCCSSTQIHY